VVGNWGFKVVCVGRGGRPDGNENEWKSATD